MNEPLVVVPSGLLKTGVTALVAHAGGIESSLGTVATPRQSPAMNACTAIVTVTPEPRYAAGSATTES